MRDICHDCVVGVVGVRNVLVRCVSVDDVFLGLHYYGGNDTLHCEYHGVKSRRHKCCGPPSWIVVCLESPIERPLER